MVASGQLKQEPTRFRVAVADDEPEMREFYEVMLPRLGYEVVGSAPDGHCLVELCLRESPDVVLTDVKMPDMDGLQALREIGTTCPVPAVVVSGYSEETLRTEGTHQGIVFLCKPIRTRDLEAAIPLACERFAALRRWSTLQPRTVPESPRTQ